MALADNKDPYIQNNGTALEPTDFNEVDEFVMQENRKILPSLFRMNPTKSLSLSNVPEPDTQQQTIIVAIVGYKLLGISHIEIAEALKTSIDNVNRIMSSPAAQLSFEKIYQNMIHVNSESIQGRIASYAVSAVDVVQKMMHDEKTRDDVRLKAAQDILDRSGSNADQFFSEKSQNTQADDELRIVIMDDSGEKEKVKVEIKKGR